MLGHLVRVLSGYRTGQAQERNQATQADANAQLAQLLQGGGNIEAAMANPRSAQQAFQYQAQAPMNDLRQRLMEARIKQAEAGPGPKFFNTPSGVAMVGPDGTAKQVYQDPAAAAKAEMLRSLLGQGAPQAAPGVQPMAGNGAPMQPTLTGGPQPGPVANPNPQPPPRAGVGGLSPEARKALGASSVLGDKSGALVYKDLTRGRDDLGFGSL